MIVLRWVAESRGGSFKKVNHPTLRAPLRRRGMPRLLFKPCMCSQKFIAIQLRRSGMFIENNSGGTGWSSGGTAYI
jgi:hypothetical protein